MNVPETSKIVYLDLNAWIDLAKIFYGQPSSLEKELLDNVLEASKNDKAIFPISLIHLSEAHCIANPQRRKKLVSFMVKLSEYYTLTPYWNKLQELEIKNLIFEKLGLPLINIRNRFVGKGFSMLMGATPTITSETMNAEEITALNKELMRLLDDPETFIKLTTTIYSDFKKKQVSTVKEFERISKNLKQYKDNNYRRKVFLTQNIVASILPKVNKILIERNLPPSFCEELFHAFDVDKFLDKLPTALCEYTLLFQRDQQSSRPIKVNDVADIWHLTLAIPYSDIVVTERMWVGIAKNARLDKKCNTIMLFSINELNKYL